jgi:hypothetical protein
MRTRRRKRIRRGGLSVYHGCVNEMVLEVRLGNLEGGSLPQPVHARNKIYS